MAVMVATAAAHGFVSGCGTGNLHELYEKEHCYPGELEACPYGEDNGEGVAKDKGADALGEDIALRLGGRRGIFEIYRIDSLEMEITCGRR